MLPDKEFFRPDEVAKHFAVKVRTIYTWINTGRLNAEKIAGSTIRITRKAIEEIREPVNN